MGEYGGKLACVFDEEVPALNVREVDMMTMANNVTYGDASMQNIPNRFVLKYVEGSVEYTAQDVILEDITLQDKAGVVNEKSIDLYGVTSQAKAWELGWFHAKWAQASKWIEFDMKPLLWDLSPSSVIKTVSSEDPYLDGREWMLVGFDETEPNHYRAKGIEYKREAYHPEDYIEEFPDVYIEDFVPSSGQNVSNVPSGTVTISLLALEHTSTGETRLTLRLNGIPTDATFVKLYRSYNGTSFALLSETEGGVASFDYTYIENKIWSYAWFKATVRSSKGETALAGAPTTQVYVTGVEENVPGFGRGEYGRQPYGY